MSQRIARLTNKILSRAEEDFETDLIFHHDFRKGLAGIEHEERKLESSYEHCIHANTGEDTYSSVAAPTSGEINDSFDNLSDFPDDCLLGHSIVIS